jgi:thiosulfate/3-mercaptopyruvate sulfurtransferase
MTYATLISITDLAARLDDRSVALVDCRYKLGDPDWGRQAWTAGHIKGAAYADLERDLSGPPTGANGRHPLPDPQALAEAFSRLGIGDDTQVVAYDQDSGMFASRLWWLLRWLGHDRVAVLDGGLARWTATGHPLSRDEPIRARMDFHPARRPEMVADVRDVEAHATDPSWRLLDARAGERYRGETEPLDRVPGHIPGAGNRHFQANLGAEGTFRPSGVLREQLQTALAGVPPEQTICYCGSGVTACHNLLALEHAGLAGAKLYPGSWSEWSSDPARPVETKARP